ncbi:MAG TPA: 30S ribosome-binding factor RbfA [Bacteroidota bacterium]|nr:30S ribosome-binding factor RbfA [Bacteroidota bacterium]
MSLRTERVSSLIKEEVGMLFAREYRDPAFGLITVTEVRVSPDLRLAKIYVSIMGSPAKRDETLRMLEGRKGEIRSFIGARVRLKFTPTVQFYIDETLDRVEKIDQLIRQIHKDDPPNHGLDSE